MQEDERLWQALKIACADGFVQELPNGLDTVLTITHRTAALEFCDRQIAFYSSQENE